MYIKQFIHKLSAIGLVLNKPLENILPHNGFVKNAVIYHTGLLGVLELSLKDLIMLIENAASVWAEHEVELVVVLFGVALKVAEGLVDAWVVHRGLGVVMERVLLVLEIVLVQHALELVR